MLDETLQPSDESYDVSDVEAFAAAYQSPSDTMGDGTAAAPTLSKPGLLVMDVDSTLIDEEVIDELGEAAGSRRRDSEGHRTCHARGNRIL